MNEKQTSPLIEVKQFHKRGIVAVAIIDGDDITGYAIEIVGKQFRLTMLTSYSVADGGTLDNCWQDLEADFAYYDNIDKPVAFDRNIRNARKRAAQWVAEKYKSKQPVR